MQRRIQYGVAISEEELGDGASVLLQGGIEKGIIQASGMGFDCVELHIRNPKDLDPARILDTSARYGVGVAAIGTGLEFGLNGLNLSSEDPELRNRMSVRLCEHIDFAAHFGAVVFLGLIRGKCARYRDRSACLDRLAEELIPIASYAAGKNVVLAFEPIAFYYTTLLNTTAETLEFLRRPGLETIQLLLDTHHMYIEDKDMDASWRQCAGRIAHVHISDSNRQYPGSGNVDYARVAKSLDGIGYEAAVSLETLPYPSGEEAALRGLSWMRSVWGR